MLKWIIHKLEQLQILLRCTYLQDRFILSRTNDIDKF